MMTVLRRTLLGAALALPFAARASTSPDVAVIGAGIAGIAAARAIQAAGRTVAVFEALNRAGGRADTDLSLDGMTFDRGAAYLESAAQNPLAAEATKLGFRTARHDLAERVHENGALARPDAQTAYAEACEELYGVLERSRAASGATALQSFMSKNSWARTAAMSMVVTDDGVDLEDLCLADWRKREGGDPYLAVSGGIGALVQRIAKGLPVSLETPVSQVREAKGGFAVDTPRGTVRAKAVIVTVSPAVLASGAIRFDPGLPPAILNAAADLQMGHLEKVAFSFDGPSALPGEEFVLVPKIGDERHHYVHIRPHGQPMAIHYAGGRYAQALVKAGAASAIDAAKRALAEQLGSQILTRVKAARATSWGTDARFLGAYAAAHPDRCGAREALSLPFSERLVLAGEALGRARHQSLDGAWASGERAAKTVLKAIN
jgi:monoamine oxidase